MASLKKRGTQWYAQYYLGRTQKRVSLQTTFYHVAKEKLRRLESGLAQGDHNPLPSRTPILLRMRWTWITPILVLVIPLAGRGFPHWSHAAEHAHVEYVHSHGHWHGDDYHEHHHSHDEAVTESLEDHAQQPHNHGWTNAPEDDSNSSTLIATTFRRHQWKSAVTFVAVAPISVFAPSTLDKSPATPPPRSHAEPVPQLAALRSIILQV
jgi:hypothetical protein